MNANKKNNLNLVKIASTADKNRPKNYELLPNVNLFKLDQRYKQNIYLEFDNQYEQAEYSVNLSKNKWKFYNNFLGYAFLAFSIMTFSTSSKCSIYANVEGTIDFDELFAIENPYNKYYSYLIFFATLGLVVCQLLNSELISISNKLYIRIYYLLITTLVNYNTFTNYCSVYVEKASELCKDQCSVNFNYNISTRMLTLMVIPEIIFNYSLKINFIQSALVLGWVSIIKLSLLDINESNRFILSRLFFNIQSLNFIKIIISFIISTGFNYFLIKGDTELWALYDSFKQSYNIIKNEYEQSSFPIFIVSRKNSQVLNYNVQGENFMINNAITAKEEEKNQGNFALRRKQIKGGYMFKDLFASQEKYDEFINKCNENCNNKDKKLCDILFSHEFIIKPPTNEANPLETKLSGNLINISNLNRKSKYDIYLQVKVLAISTFYKTQECLLIQLITDETVEEKDFLFTNYKSILDKISNMIENIDTPLNMCPEIQSQIEQSEAKKTTQNANVLCSPNSFLNQNTPTTNNLVNQSSVNPGTRLKYSQIAGIINEIKKNLPKPAYSFGYYLMLTSKMLYNKLLSHELLEKNYTMNNCITKSFSHSHFLNHHVLSMFNSHRKEQDQLNVVKKTHSTNRTHFAEFPDSKLGNNIAGVNNNINIENHIRVEKKTSKKSSSFIDKFDNDYFNNSFKGIEPMDCDIVIPRPFFEDILSSVNLYSKYKNASISLNCTGNDNININKDLYQVVLFNICCFILSNFDDNIESSISLDNLIKLRISQEKTGFMGFMFKFNTSTKIADKFSDIKNLYDLYFKIDKENNDLNKVQSSYMDKFKAYEPGFILAIHLIEVFSNKKIAFNIDQIKKTSSNDIVKKNSTNVLKISSDVEIKFYLPFTSNNEKIENDYETYKYLNEYSNRVMKMVYNIDIFEKERNNKNIDKNNNSVFDNLSDDYNEDEENYTVEEDNKNIYEPLKNSLAQPILMLVSNHDSDKIKPINSKQNIASTIQYITTQSGKFEKCFPKKTILKPQESQNFRINLLKIQNEDIPQASPNFGGGSKLKKSSKNVIVQENSPKKEIIQPITKLNWDITKFNIRYFSTPRYLIVEDNYLGRKDLGRNIFEYNPNHYIDLAEHGSEAISKFTNMLTQGYIYDFVFMDIDLPYLDGIQVTKKIRETEKRFKVHTKIAAVTVGVIEGDDYALFDMRCIFFKFSRQTYN